MSTRAPGANTPLQNLESSFILNPVGLPLPEANNRREGCMRLDQEGESSNVEDRRGFRVSPGMAGGGIGTLVILLIGLYLGVDPSARLQQTGVDTSAPPVRQAGAPDEMRTFVSRVLASTERTWGEIFEQNGR